MVLRSFDSVYEEGSDHITIDLVAAAAEFGLTLGADTLIRFQMFDDGGTFTESRYQPYRTLDNVLITTDQQLRVALPDVAKDPVSANMIAELVEVPMVLTIASTHSNTGSQSFVFQVRTK